MSNRFTPSPTRALSVLCGALLVVFPARAQETAAATSRPVKADPTGMGLLQKDRPKNARTEITCKDESTFDNPTGIATFLKSVVVKDPQFNLFCDKLTVYLNKQRKGIDNAVAEGNVVIVQDNTNEKGDPVKSIGRSGKCVFVPASGEATLTISPSLQQGINNHIATEPATVMILNRDGRLKTVGPSRTVIVDADKAGQQ